ncbi:MAG: hypothetical protein E7A62_02070 [Actinomycetaceae bacterium]|nr:hypothetical protein [Actinomycetaceae bacterium]MDU0969766.1 hypothetical protein [Actinomycetaceae bacterium]
MKKRALAPALTAIASIVPAAWLWLGEPAVRERYDLFQPIDGGTWVFLVVCAVLWSLCVIAVARRRSATVADLVGCVVLAFVGPVVGVLALAGSVLAHAGLVTFGWVIVLVAAVYPYVASRDEER